MKMTIWQKWITFFVLTIILGIPAFYNGFPMLFPDAIGYITTGFENEINVSQTWMYSIFLRHISLWESLWFVILVQGLMVIGTVHLMFKYFFQEQHKDILFVIYCLIISATTALSFHVSGLMPDVFTPVVILSFCLLLFAPKLTKKDLFLAIVLFVFSLGVHNSHILLIGLLLLILWLSRVSKTSQILYQQVGITGRKIMVMTLLTLGAYLTVCTIHYVKDGSFSATKGGGIRLFARLCDLGIAQSYLNAHCSKMDNKICEHIEHLSLGKAFLRSKDSYFNTTGGWSIENEHIFRELNYAILTTPRYFKRYIIAVIEGTFMQLFYYEYSPLAEMEGARSKGFLECMDAYFSFYYWAVFDTLQLKAMYSDLQIKLMNAVQHLIIGLSSLLFLLLFLDKKYAKEQKVLALFIVLGLFINAFVVSATMGVSDRYQSRVAWLVTLPAFWFFYYNLKRIKKIVLSLFNQ